MPGKKQPSKTGSSDAKDSAAPPTDPPPPSSSPRPNVTPSSPRTPDPDPARAHLTARALVGEKTLPFGTVKVCDLVSWWDTVGCQFAAADIPVAAALHVDLSEYILEWWSASLDTAMDGTEEAQRDPHDKKLSNEAIRAFVLHLRGEENVGITREAQSAMCGLLSDLINPLSTSSAEMLRTHIRLTIRKIEKEHPSFFTECSKPAARALIHQKDIHGQQCTSFLASRDASVGHEWEKTAEWLSRQIPRIVDLTSFASSLANSSGVPPTKDGNKGKEFKPNSSTPAPPRDDDRPLSKKNDENENETDEKHDSFRLNWRTSNGSRRGGYQQRPAPYNDSGDRSTAHRPDHPPPSPQPPDPQRESNRAPGAFLSQTLPGTSHTTAHGTSPASTNRSSGYAFRSAPPPHPTPPGFARPSHNVLSAFIAPDPQPSQSYKYVPPPATNSSSYRSTSDKGYPTDTDDTYNADPLAPSLYAE